MYGHVYLIKMLFIIGLCSSCSVEDKYCPVLSGQRDVLKVDLLSLPNAPLNDSLRIAIGKIYACNPPHPILGGAAILQFIDARYARNGQVYLSFQVKGLTDIMYVFLVDSQGNLVDSYLYG